MYSCVLNCFSYVQLCEALWTVAYQAPLSMGFSRQEYCSGLPCPSPEELTYPGIEPMSLALAGGFFTTSATWKTPSFCVTFCIGGFHSIGCRIAAPFSSGVCPLVSEVGPKSCAGFLVYGLVPAHWLGELGLTPLVGKTVSRPVFRVDCELRMTLGSLSVDEWGCVSALWVVWSDMSQQWSLQAVELGQDSVPKWWPLREFKMINICRDFCH